MVQDGTRVKGVQKCWDEPREICDQVPSEKCWDEPRQECREVPRQEYKDVLRQNCNQVPLEKCNLVPGVQTSRQVPRSYTTTECCGVVECVSSSIQKPVQRRQTTGFNFRPKTKMLLETQAGLSANSKPSCKQVQRQECNPINRRKCELVPR